MVCVVISMSPKHINIVAVKVAFQMEHAVYKFKTVLLLFSWGLFRTKLTLIAGWCSG